MLSMQTVNFQCGHCRNVMGVNAAYLGKQVRCPHCQQVVLAPAQAPTPAPAPVAVSPPAGPAPGQSKAAPDPEDSIFGEQVDEDLFGSPPKRNLDLLLPQTPKTNQQLEPTVFQVPGLDPGAFPPGANPGLVSNSSPQMAPPPPITSATETLPEPPAEAPVASVPGSPEAESAEGALPRLTVRRPESSTLATSMLIILIPYSILMTAIALFLYFKQQSQVHPLEMMPDLGNPPSKRVGGNPLPVLKVGSHQRWKADAPLAPYMITKLGQPITVGDLEVTPLGVELKRVTFKSRLGHQDELSEHEALVLQLQFKNVSQDVEFRPADIAFDYKWRDGMDAQATMPYTFLELSNAKRYCGAFVWRPAVNRNQPAHAAGSHEYIEGQEEASKILQPGESSKTVIFTLGIGDRPDPGQTIGSALKAHRGPLLWRVHLRRGIVNYKERDYSTTAVIGVEFNKEDIVKK
jgi:hypothetical protein